MAAAEAHGSAGDAFCSHNPSLLWLVLYDSRSSLGARRDGLMGSDTEDGWHRVCLR